MSSLEIAEKIIKRLIDCGYRAYVAGGWVRDFLMNHPSDDIDIATDAPVEEIQAIFEKTIPVGVLFGIVIVVEEGHHFEVATFRRDIGTLDGRRPSSIERASPEEDAKRRDFTINGMFYDPIEKTVHDFVGGEADLKEGIIRAIGNPHERFLEDRLRMIRAVRYSARFHFPIESMTMRAIYDHAEQLLPAVAYERIWQEFEKMTRFPHFATALTTLHRLSLLPTIFPSLRDLPVEEILSRLRHLDDFPKTAPLIAQILELFPESTLEEKLDLCLTFRLSKKEQEFARFLHKMEVIFREGDDNLELFDWAKLYADERFNTCLEIYAVKLKNREPFIKEHAHRIERLDNAIARIKSQTPIIRAHHLKEEGILPGKAMGRLLEQAERLAINESIEDKKILLEKLKNSPLWPQ